MKIHKTGENICKQCNQQGINLQNIATAYMAQVKNQTTQSKKWKEDLNRCFSKEDIQMAKRHLKIWSALLIIKEMQIKTTIRYVFTLVRIATIEIFTENKSWRKCGKKRALIHCWWGRKLIQPLWGTVGKFLKRLKIELPYDWVIPLLGMYLEKTMVQKDTFTPVFTAAVFTIARIWKQPKCTSQRKG